MNNATQLHLLTDSAVLLILAIAVIASVFFFIFYYLRRNTKLRDEIEELRKQGEYNHKLFDEHFKITDQTITDLRADKTALTKTNQKLVDDLESTMEKLKKMSKATKLQ